MRDKIIISTISKTYFIITSLLFFIFFSLSVLFIVLQNGLYIENISIPNIKVKQLYIKWNENLDVSIKEIHITADKNQNDSKIELDVISKYLHKLPHLYNIFEKISINKITFNEFSSSFKYEKGHDGYLLLSSPDFTLNSSLCFIADSLHVTINEFNDSNRDIKVSGTVILNPIMQDLTTSLVIDIHNEISLHLLAFVNQKKLYYKINSLDSIKSIDYVMEQLELNKDLQYWAYKAIDFSSLTLKNVYGWVDFSNLDDAYKNIYASATANDLKYAYNKNLDRIHTKKTDLEFKNGTLYIYPRQATTYKSKLGSSWLKIDFTLPEELLTLKLLFNGKLDQDTLGILEEFKIKVPVLQNTGKTKVDLTLKVNLRTIDVDAQGVFFTRVANFKYYGYDIDVFNTKVELNNYDIRIKKILAKYQDIIDTEIDVVFNAKTSKGLLNFRISKINLDAIDLKLKTKNKYLKASYSIHPSKDSIRIDKSYWNFKERDIALAKIIQPIDIDTLKLVLPRTRITSPQLGKAYVQGKINLNKQTAKLKVNVKDIYFGEIELDKKNNFLTLNYDKALIITSKDVVHFGLNSEKSFLNPFTVTLKDNVLLLNDTYLNIGNLLKTKLNAYYDTNKKLGYLQTRRTRFSTNEFGLLYFNQDATKFDIKVDNNATTTIESKDLEIKLTNTKEVWDIDFSSLHLLSLRSEFLKKYFITNGSIQLLKMKNKKDIEITSKVKYPYPFIVKNNIPAHNYTLQGSFNTKTNALTAKLNDNINIVIDETIDIKAKNIGININAIVDITNSLKSNSKDSSKVPVTIEAKDSHLYISENRHVLSEDMYLYYENKVLTAGLLHQEGISGLKYEDSEFYAYGEKFNDVFMDKLFALSDFDGGNFEFNMSGNTQKYEGIFTIDNSTILDYKVLNNILAFVNTIPSLATFSTPGYNSKGIHLKTAYMKFSSEDDIFNISDIYFHSKELDILGKGTASFKTNEVDVALKLRTDIGSSLAKIPIVGYLILDGDSLSSTLSVTGALDNPEINTLIGEEIIIAPLKILFRTLMLPDYFLNSEKEKE